MSTEINLETIEAEGKNVTYIKAPREALADVPDKFWHPDRGLNVTAMMKSYGDAEAGMRQAESRVRAQIEKEQSDAIPQTYSINAPELDGAPENFRETLRTDPFMRTLEKAAAAAKMTQPQFDAVVHNVATASVAAQREADKQIREALGENFDERWQTVTGKLKSQLGDAYNQVASTLKNPDVFKSLEKMVTSQPGTPAGEGGTGSGLTEADLKKMTDDPRYWHPQKKDPSYVDEVTRKFKQFYGDQKFDPRKATG